jgi:glucose-1-phosphate adenylyltransferase
MDPEQMVEQHIASGAGVTVAGIRVPRSDAHRFGVIEPASDSNRIKSFLEKPLEAPGLPDAPDEVFASMGNYVFTAKVLVDAVVEDAKKAESHHDMGGDIITMLVERGDAAVYDFRQNHVPGTTDRDRGYWRDVGTLDSYYDANMDLVSVHPVFNLYNQHWPIHTWYGSLPPAKFVFDDEGRRGFAVNSIVSAGVIVAGGSVRRCVLSPGVRVESGAVVEDSVLLQDVQIGEGAIVKKTILDKNVVVPPGARIGVERELDEARGFTLSDNGVVVIGKADPIAP